MRATATFGLLAVACVVAFGGCGGGNASAPAKPVRLSLDAPRDTAVVQSDSITVRGSVSPASAQVRVRGERAEVSGGQFRARVALELGTNVIDVMASASRNSPAFTAVRVTRQETVRIPDLAGVSADEARAQLDDLGLRAKIKRKGGIIEELVPRTARVCGTSPGSGESVVRGTTVEVRVGKLC